MGWKDQAACRETGIGPFFNRRTQADKDATEAFCGSCPVKAECLAYALKHEKSDNLRIGVWGGTSPADRIEIAKEG
jgi:WhiB family redox-sensing transcriptional regulator